MAVEGPVPVTAGEREVELPAAGIVVARGHPLRVYPRLRRASGPADTHSPDRLHGGRMGYRFVQAKVDRALLGDALVVAGGLLIGLGVLLPWGKVVVGPLHENIAGINGWEGRFTGILAIGMLVRGALAWKAHQEGRDSRQAVLAAVAASGRRCGHQRDLYSLITN